MIESFIWTLVGAAIGIVGTVIVQKQSDKKHEEAERGKVAQAASEERAKQLRYWDNLNCDSDREPMDPTTVSLFYDVRTWLVATRSRLVREARSPFQESICLLV